MKQAEKLGSPRTPNEGAVRMQLARILASPSFSKSERLSGFLAFVVEQTLRGTGSRLKEAVLARELYNKDSDFDTAIDPVVRVDARRLRDKLREYYSDFADDPVLVAIPKGGYAPTFEWNPGAVGPVAVPVPSLPGTTSAPPPLYLRPRILAAVCAGLLGILGAALLVLRHDRAETASTAVPLTAYAGSEGPPSLSPDGQFVAFAWTGAGKSPASHIYIKEVHGEAVRQLTDGPASERDPSWSPDGSHVAFVRPGEGVFVISPLGGAGRKISGSGTHVGWASDSKSVLIRDLPPGLEKSAGPFGIYQISLDTLERRRITQPSRGIGDWVFSVSPDGQNLAFARYEVPGLGDVFVAPMSGGEPRRLTNWASNGIAVAWTPNGREIVYSVKEPQGGRLWRIAWNGASPGRGTPVAGQTGDAGYPSISRPGPNQPARLAYQVGYLDIGLRLVDLDVISGTVLTSVQPLADSTRLETAAGFSPDGAKVAFASNRGGAREIWVCNRDGSDLSQLTFLGASNILPGGWSPDRRMFLVEAAVNGKADIYVVPAAGGKLKRLTTDPYFHSAPSWSRDGKSIYFSSNRSASPDPEHPSQIWRMPAGGGDAVQITRTGGFFAQQSFDGKFLYCVDRPPGGISSGRTLLRIPVEGGAPVTVLEGVHLWSLTRKGIYFVTSDGGADTVNLYRMEAGKATTIGSLPFPISPIAGGMAVSEDGRWLITQQLNRNDTDLMLIENFN